MTAISYQLYCSRNFPPLADTLSMLAAAGFKEVEGFGGLYGDAAGLRAMLDASGLRMPTGHFGLSQIEDQRAEMLKAATTLGMSAVIVPYVMPDDRPTDARGWAAFGQRLVEAGKPFQDAGFAFGWHNHDFEFAKTDSDLLPIELIADAGADMKIELDIGWVVRAGHDPVRWVNKLGSKIIAAHVKDIAPKGENADEDGWADVGHGTIDWKPIMAALDGVGCGRIVLEHDNPKDHKRFATRSLASAMTF